MKSVEFTEPEIAESPKSHKVKSSKASKKSKRDEIPIEESESESESDCDPETGDYDDDDDDDDDEDEDDLMDTDDMEGMLAEVVEGVFTTEDGVTMADVSQEISEHLGNITKVLGNTNKILIKILQKIQ